MNVILQLEFELVYFGAAILHFSHWHHVNEISEFKKKKNMQLYIDLEDSAELNTN